jgi:hypothetical protein
MSHRLRTTWAAALLVGVTVLAGCGDQAGGGDATGSDETTSESPTGGTDGTSDGSTSSTDGGAAGSGSGSGSAMQVSGDADAVAIGVVSASNADGEVSQYASVLRGRRQVRGFVAPLAPHLKSEVRQAVRTADVPEGRLLFGAVVAIGCETPTGITVDHTWDGYQVTAQVPKSGIQCLVPVTSVALFHVPAL